MNYPWVDEYLLSKPGVSKDFKAEWGWFRYLLGDKMFAAVCLDQAGKPSLITFKLEPSAGEFLRKQYPEDVVPGYYMNKVHWNSARACGGLPERELRQALDESYHLVLAGLTKKSRAALLGEG